MEILIFALSKFRKKNIFHFKYILLYIKALGKI